MHDQHVFRRQKYNLRFVKMRRSKGECDAPHCKQKTISIDPRLEPRQLMYTFIHEALHACLWDLDEEAIHETARDVQTFLWRLGYRQQPQPQRRKKTSKGKNDA